MEGSRGVLSEHVPVERCVWTILPARLGFINSVCNCRHLWFYELMNWSFILEFINLSADLETGMETKQWGRARFVGDLARSLWSHVKLKQLKPCVSSQKQVKVRGGT